MELIDREKLLKQPIDTANYPSNFVKHAPTVEAISKDQYENRLKADMVAMLTEIQLEMEGLRFGQPPRKYVVDECLDVIQQKIDALKADEQQGENS